jgi:hypothetical protein
VRSRTTVVLTLLSACVSIGSTQELDGVWHSLGWGFVYDLRGTFAGF